jgi:glycosyltransferase involved in cell wall biosynthesis
VGLLATCFPRFTGDLAGNFVLQCGRRLQERGHVVEAVAPHASGLPVADNISGVSVRRFRYAWPDSAERLAYDTMSNLAGSWRARLALPSYVVAFAASAARLLRRSDLLHAFWVPSALVAVAVRLFGLRRPVVATLLGSDLSLVRMPLLGGLVRALLARADALTVVSASMAEALVEVGLPPSRIHVTRNAADPPPAPREPRSLLRERLGLPRERTVALFLGRLSAVKGPDVLVEAARRLQEEPGRPLVVLVGGGPQEAALRREAAGLEGDVVFAGTVAHAEVGRWLAAADFLVLPSRSEGLPHSVLEAFAYGLPAVASRVGGVPEVVREGETGWLVPPGSADALAAALLSAARDADGRARLGENARSLIEREGLSWDRLAGEFALLYEGLAGDEAASPERAAAARASNTLPSQSKR